MTVAHIFVYGTLRQSRPAAGRESIPPIQLARHARRLGDATVAGRLYDLGRYPGLVDSDSPADRVRGELYRMHRPDELLPRLDEYECCIPHAPARSEFVRTVCPVHLTAADRTLHAWVYFYNRAVNHLHPIPTNDWLAAAP